MPAEFVLLEVGLPRATFEGVTSWGFCARSFGAFSRYLVAQGEWAVDEQYVLVGCLLSWWMAHKASDPMTNSVAKSCYRTRAFSYKLKLRKQCQQLWLLHVLRSRMSVRC